MILNDRGTTVVSIVRHGRRGISAASRWARWRTARAGVTGSLAVELHGVAGFTRSIFLAAGQTLVQSYDVTLGDGPRPRPAGRRRR